MKDKVEIHIWVDGWCKGNGTPSTRAGWSAAAVTKGNHISFVSGLVPNKEPQTSNVAEYHALIHGLWWGKQYEQSIVIHSDSALVVGQVTCGWGVKVEYLRPLVEEAATLVLETGARVIKEPRERIVEVLGH